MTESGKRGPYAKGVARRQQILRAALAAYAESDASGPSLRSIAARVGLSERGLLHYFASRDELLVAILAERDAADLARFDPEGNVDQLSAVVRNAAHTPGLVRLFSEMSAAAADTESVANAHFTLRYAQLRAILEEMFGRDAEREADQEAEFHAVDAAFAARILIAASDGLQQQWLLEPTIDLDSDLRHLARLLDAVLRGSPSAPDSGR